MIEKKVRLIAVLGEAADEAGMLLTKILRSSGFIASTLNQNERGCKEALATASGVCDFIVVNASLLTEDTLCGFNLETMLVLCGAEGVDIRLLSEFKNIVLPYSLSKSVNIKEKKLLSYSMDNNEADLIAKNINPQGDKTMFELLGTGVIGRVKLSNSSGFSAELVLAVSSALIAMGIPLASVLDVVNRL